MIPFEGPQVLGFLEYLRKRYPYLKKLSDISLQERRKMAEHFSEIHLNGEDRKRWDEVWEPFIKTCSQEFRFEFDGNSKKIVPERRDALERYRSIGCHALLFYTSEDKVLNSFIKEHWFSLNETLGSKIDLYDFCVHRGHTIGSFHRAYLERLEGIPGVNGGKFLEVGLPCLLLWSADTSVVITLDKYSNSEETLTKFFRELIKFIPNELGLLEFASDQLTALSQPEFFDDMESWPRLQPLEGRVFISYRRLDFAIADFFERKLNSLGITTFIDTQIPTGEMFRSRIFSQINKADMVLMLWTTGAENHPWVLREGMVANHLGKLFPVANVGNEVPSQLAGVNFRFINFNNLSVWNKELVRMLDDIWKKLGKPEICDTVFPGREIKLDRQSFERSLPAQILEPNYHEICDAVFSDREIKIDIQSFERSLAFQILEPNYPEICDAIFSDREIKIDRQSLKRSLEAQILEPNYPEIDDLHPEVQEMYSSLRRFMSIGMLKRNLRRVRRSLKRHPLDVSISIVEIAYTQRIEAYDTIIELPKEDIAYAKELYTKELYAKKLYAKELYAKELYAKELHAKKLYAKELIEYHGRGCPEWLTLYL